MKEQSHKREMAAALRGDFARLRERGVAATIGADTTPDAVEPPRPGPDRPDEITERASVVRRLLRFR